MASLDTIVDISLSVAGPSVQVESFGIPLVAGSFTSPAWTERVHIYTSAADVLAAGFAATSPIYRAAAAVFAQDPAPAQVAVGRLALPPTNTVEITPVAANSRLYSLDVLGVDGVLYTAAYTSDASATVAEITAGLTAAVNALAAGCAITAVDGTAKVTIAADAAGAYFGVAPTVGCEALMSFAQTHADPGIATDLAAIAAENSSWYGVTLANDQGAATITAAAVWCASNKKLFIPVSQDSAIVASGSADVASVVKATSNGYASVFFHRRAGLECAGAATLGVLFSRDPGAVVLHGKRLVNVTADALSGSEVNYALAKYALHYTVYGSLPMLREGRVASGQWVDVVRDLDWFAANLQDDLVSVIVNNDKLVYTDAGVALLANATRSRLAIAEAAGVFDSGWLVTVPKVADVSSVDRGNRVYRTLRWSARLAGAIQTLGVRGTVAF